MSDSRVTVFPVPEGISRTQFPVASSVSGTCQQRSSTARQRPAHSSSRPCSCRSSLVSALPASTCFSNVDVRILLYRRVSREHVIAENKTCLDRCAGRGREQAGRCGHCQSRGSSCQSHVSSLCAHSMLNSILKVYLGLPDSQERVRVVVCLISCCLAFASRG